MRTSKKIKQKNDSKRYLRLCDSISLRSLEEHYVYNKVADELYEVDDTAIDFLRKCDGIKDIPRTGSEGKFVEFCMKEGILQEFKRPCVRKEVKIHTSDMTPSFRYLELIVTDRCNLMCKHCYIEKSGSGDLPVHSIKKIFDEFEKSGGIRLMVSGGEPVLHKDFKHINDLVRHYDFRAILLTNGFHLNKYIISELNFNEVQVSLDGMRRSHDYIRAPGSFDKAVTSIKLLRHIGIDVSVATMALRTNALEFDELGEFIRGLGVNRWVVDVPCVTNDNEDIFLDTASASKYFKYGFASSGSVGLYNSAQGYACGAHLMTVMNTGAVSKCSFFADEPVGDISGGLAANFAKVRKLKLEELECDCDLIEECRGGCRYRAILDGGITKKDKAKCHYFL